MSDSGVLLSTRQAAAVLGVTVRTVARMANAGDLVPYYQIDGARGAMVFRASDVHDLKRRRTRETPAA